MSLAAALSNTAQQQSFDYRELKPDDRGFVKGRAVLIRETAKRTAEGIVLIGQWLTEAKARIPHGQWLPWLKTEFGWALRTAQNFMRVYEQSKNANFANLDIDVSALYLIAAPKTPELVRNEVIERARNGEPMSRAKAVDVLEQYKARCESPPPTVARAIATATGKLTADNTGVYRTPGSTPESERAADEHTKATFGVIFDIERLAAQVLPLSTTAELLGPRTEKNPAELAELLRDWECDGMGLILPALIQWLDRFQKELKTRGKI